MPITRADVGCWVVKVNPKLVWNYLSYRKRSTPNRQGLFTYNWTLHDTYRNGLIRKGDLIALLVTGVDEAGIYEIGQVTGPVITGTIDQSHLVDHKRAGQEVEMVPFRSARLPHFLPRSSLKADQILARSEPIRIPRMGNPTYLTPDETVELGHKLYLRLPDSQAAAVGWAHLLIPRPVPVPPEPRRGKARRRR